MSNAVARDVGGYEEYALVKDQLSCLASIRRHLVDGETEIKH